MTPDRDRPGPDGADPHGSEPIDDAADVRRMLHDRSRSITPRGTFTDVQERIDHADADRRRNRTLVSAAAAVVLVVLIAGGIALANRETDETQRLDTADSTTTVVSSSTTAPGSTTTGGQEQGTTTTGTTEATGTADPTATTEPTEPTDTDAEPPGVQPISEQTPVRIDGIGPISVPVAVADAAAATGQPIAIDPDSIIDESVACRFAQDPALPGIWYMVDRDRIVRVDITGDGPSNRTEAGVGIGSSKADVLAAYAGRVTEEPHPYAMDENSRNLVVTDPERPSLSMIFSVHQGAVVDYRVGLADWVAAPEGCA